MRCAADGRGGHLLVHAWCVREGTTARAQVVASPCVVRVSVLANSCSGTPVEVCDRWLVVLVGIVSIVVRLSVPAGVTVTLVSVIAAVILSHSPPPTAYRKIFGVQGVAIAEIIPP